MLDHLITSFPPDGERIYQAIAKYWFSRESKNFSIRVFWGKKKRQIMFISHQKQMAVTRVVLAVFRAVVDLPGL